MRKILNLQETVFLHPLPEKQGHKKIPGSKSVLILCIFLLENEKNTNVFPQQALFSLFLCWPASPEEHQLAKIHGKEGELGRTGDVVPLQHVKIV